MRDSNTTIGGGAWLTPYSYLIDARPQNTLRARSPEPADSTLFIDLGTQRMIGLIHIQNLRVTQFAVMRVEAGTDHAFASHVYDTGLISAWPLDKAQFSTTPWGETTPTGQIEPQEYLALGMPRFFVFPTPAWIQYVRIGIIDPAADVAAQIGAVGVCEVWEPQRGPDLGWSVGWRDESDVRTTPFGSRFFTVRGKRRVLHLGLSNISADEFWSIAFGWVGMMGRTEPLVAAVFPDDALNIEKRAVYGTISEDLVTTDNPYFATYRVPFTVEQLI